MAEIIEFPNSGPSPEQLAERRNRLRDEYSHCLLKLSSLRRDLNMHESPEEEMARYALQVCDLLLAAMAEGDEVAQRKLFEDSRAVLALYEGVKNGEN